MAGKSTYVEQHAKPGDVILDYDEIARELGSPDPWDHPKDIGYAAEAEMQRRLAALPADRDAWIVRCAPGPERDRLAATLGAEVVLLDVPAEEAKARAARDGRPPWTADAIDRWWRIHTKNHPDMGVSATAALKAGARPDEATGVRMSDNGGAQGAENGGQAGTENGAENGQQGQGQAFTQADVDRIVGERIQRERAKYADYDDLKAKAEGAKTAEDRIAELEQKYQAAETARLRSDIAAAHGITAEDRDLFLTGTDEETLTKQAERLAAHVTERRKNGNRAPLQGRTPNKAAGDDEERAATRSLFGG